MLNISKELLSYIDESGSLIKDNSDYKPIIDKSETLAKSMLGCTLHVRGRNFIIRMLEIYYGGLADDAHDWYRTRFTYKTSKYKEHTAIQSEEGFKIYISSFIPDDTYARFDIVAGPAGVPVSFLVRSVWDENFQLIGAKDGSPNKVLRELGLKNEDHGTNIILGPAIKDGIALEDTHDRVINDRNLTIKQRRRINVNSGFEELHSVYWNFYLE